MSVRCANWSIENKQCKFNYTDAPLINKFDINPLCSGYSTVCECTWFKPNNTFYYAGRF